MAFLLASSHFLRHTYEDSYVMLAINSDTALPNSLAKKS